MAKCINVIFGKMKMFPLVLLFLLISCSEKHTKLNLSNGVQEFTIAPPGENNTTFHLKLEGWSNSDIEISVSRSKTICISKGPIVFWKNYEWYSGSRNVVFSLNEKNEEYDLQLSYDFSMQYWGQRNSSKYVSCSK